MTSQVVSDRDLLGQALEASVSGPNGAPTSSLGSGQDPAGGSASSPSTAGGGRQAPTQAPRLSSTPTQDVLTTLELDQVLNHPSLGPKLQSWADKSSAKKIADATANLRSQVEAQLRPQIEAETERQQRREYLSSLDDRERGTVLAADRALAIEWGKMQEEASRPQPSPEETALAVTVQAVGAQIRAVNQVLKESPLPAEVKAQLDPRNYATGRGVDDLVTWSTAVQNAIIQHHAKAQAGSLAQTQLQALQEEQAQKANSFRPGSPPPGRTGNVLPDLNDYSGEELLAMALSERR